MLKGESPIVDWDGKQSRDFTYVSNVVDANLRSCVTPDISGEFMNVACGTTTSVIDIVNTLNKMMKARIVPEFAPKRPGDVRKTCADITKMSKFLKIKKMVQFEEGLGLTLDWFRNK